MQIRTSLGELRGAIDPQWLMLACALVAAVLLYRARGSTLAEGQEVAVRFSLITADKTAAMCASQAPIFERACRYAVVDRAPSETPHEGTLQPFGTVRGPLYLVDDLFADRAVAARFAAEPPEGKSIKQLKRFEARCTLRLLGRAPPVHIRFGKAAPWSSTPGLWVGVPLGCKVIG